MVLKYYPLDESSYLLSVIPNPIFNKINVITECSDPNCIYSRTTSRLREKFEEGIHRFIGLQKDINILFYGSYLLAQEIKIIALLSDKISEIHITDFAYDDWEDNDDNTFHKAFMQLMEIIYKNQLNTRVYLHANPIDLVSKDEYHRRFDVICGIDFEYTQQICDHRKIMNNIARNCLKKTGMLFSSQNAIDQVDLCYYKLDDTENIKLVETIDYVKEPFYKTYLLEEFFNKSYNFFIVLSLLILHISIKIANIFTIFGLLYVYAAIFSRCIRKRKYNFKRSVISLDTIKVNSQKNDCSCHTISSVDLMT